MATKPKLIGIRWSEGRFELTFYGLAAFVKYERPVIPGIEFDEFLYYEPSANKAEYTLGGMAYQMTPEHKASCEAYVAQIEIPGFSYDPLRYNIYTGVKTSKEADAEGLALTYTAITTEKSKFNETEDKWEAIYAAICSEGRVFFDLTNDYENPVMIDDEGNEVRDAGSTCSNNIQNAVMILTEEEWKLISSTRTRPTDVYDFQNHKWIDDRIVEDEMYMAKSRLTGIVENVTSAYQSQHFFGLPTTAVEALFSMDAEELKTNALPIAQQFSEDADATEMDAFVDSLRAKWDDFVDRRKRAIYMVAAFGLLVQQCSTLEELDKIIAYIDETTQVLFEGLSDYEDTGPDPDIHAALDAEE